MWQSERAFVPCARAVAGRAHTQSCEKQLKQGQQKPGEMRAHPPSARQIQITVSKHALPAPRTVRDDAVGTPAFVSTSYRRPPSLEPPPGASPGKTELREWPE